MRETESLLTAAQNNAIRTNYIKSKIDNTQLNSKHRLCVNEDEKVDHTKNEFSKLVQKEYNIRYEYVRKFLQWEFLDRLKLNHTTKFTNQNETHKNFFREFDIQTDHLIPARRVDLELIKKNTSSLVDFSIPVNWSENKRYWKYRRIF